MKLVSLSKAILLMLVSSACALIVACGAGSDVPPAPIVSVSSTQNPLVAQVTVVAACPGQAMVEFGPNTSYGRSTSWYPVSGHYQPSPILVAGMRASTTYHMRAQTQCVGNTTTSQDLTFSTGPLPSIAFPALTVTRPNPSLSSAENPGIEMMTITEANNPAFFTDRDANTIWYYDVGKGNYPFMFKLLPDGNIILDIVSPTDSTLREVDLAGNTIRQMDIYTLQQKMQNAGGFDFIPAGFHHDSSRSRMVISSSLWIVSRILPTFPDIPEQQKSREMR